MERDGKKRIRKERKESERNGMEWKGKERNEKD